MSLSKLCAQRGQALRGGLSSESMSMIVTSSSFAPSMTPASLCNEASSRISEEPHPRVFKHHIITPVILRSLAILLAVQPLKRECLLKIDLE